MAVQCVSKTTSQYIGLSSDIKPSYAINGSTFHAVDTGELYVYFDGMWEDDLRLVNAVKLANWEADLATLEA